MNKDILRKIIIDAPTDQDLFRGKGHERTAAALVDAIREFDNVDRAVGLDGPWGSGKSSVVEIAAKMLEESPSSDGPSFHFFTFDIWKSQGSAFRRSFLEYLLTWAKSEFPDQRAELDDIEKNVKGKTRIVETDTQPLLDWYGIVLLILLPFLPIFYFWAKGTFDALNELPDSGSFLLSKPFLLLVAFVLVTIFVAWKTYRTKKKTSQPLTFKAAFSRTMLISSKQHQDQKVTQTIREVDPNDYEFHITLRQVLGLIQADGGRVVLVLDNIDRLPRDEIPEYWALVRSIFSRAEHDKTDAPERALTAIVPYDRKLIELGVVKENLSDTNKSGAQLTKLSSREVFSKTFDEVLTVAPPVLSNARDFFADKLKEALPGGVQTGDVFRTYRIFSELLRAEGGTTTPRQIVSFINDLCGLYVLHAGKYRLPTVAAYLAHHDTLDGDPSILSKKDGLDERIASFSGDPELNRNLAAMVFNVDADLAFQILLDEPIAQAASASDADDLISISSAPGFDLRVVDVMSQNLEGWVGAGDFPQIVDNFFQLFLVYKGDAKTHMASTLVSGADNLSFSSLKPSAYTELFALFDLAEDQVVPRLIEKFISAVSAHLSSVEALTYDIGIEHAEFLEALHKKVEEKDELAVFKAKLKSNSVPTDADFLLGLAAGLSETDVRLASFGKIVVDVPDGETPFEDFATQDPSIAMDAFQEFDQANMLGDEQWASIGSACIKVLTGEPDKSSEIPEIWKLLVLVWKSSAKPEELIDLKDAFSKGQLYTNLGDANGLIASEVISSVYFLASQLYLDTDLPVPTKVQANGQPKQDNSEQFLIVKSLLTGDGELDKTLATVVASHVRDARKASKWVSYGAEHPDNKATEAVVRELFALDELPYLKLAFLIKQFEYLQGLLSRNAFVDMLASFDSRITAADITDLKFEELRLGFLTACNAANGPNTRKILDHFGSLLKGVSRDDWVTNLEGMTHEAQVLREFLSLEKIQLSSLEYREPFLNTALGVLNGTIEPSADKGMLDVLLGGLDKSYHSEIWRSLREDVKGVSVDSLAVATKLFPNLVKDIVSSGDRIMKPEKDNVIRYMLCSALEGENKITLEAFVELGYARISDYIASSEESTKQKLEGALNAFRESGADRNWIRTVGEAIEGKKKTKVWWDIFSPT